MNRILSKLRITKRHDKINVAGEIGILTFLDSDTNSWVAFCKELDVSSSGNTEDRAISNCRQAIDLFFSSCLARGTLEQALKELGWVCENPNRTIADCDSIRIPPAFILGEIQKTRSGVWSSKISFGQK